MEDTENNVEVTVAPETEPVQETAAPKHKYNKKTPEERNIKQQLKELKAENTLLKNKVDNLNILCTKFKDQYDCADAAYQRLKIVSKDREAYLKNLLHTSYEAAARMEDLKA